MSDPEELMLEAGKSLILQRHTHRELPSEFRRRDGLPGDGFPGHFWGGVEYGEYCALAENPSSSVLVRLAACEK